jgi:arylsulfatase A-like enzyme
MYAKADFTTTGWEPAAANALAQKKYLNDIVGNSRKAAASLTALDDQIPPLLAKLQQRGLRENTAIVFTSATGYLLGRHGLWSDGLASNPINMYEEAVQSPLIWHWLGQVPPESVRPELVSTYDLVPTVCDLLELPLPSRNLCGRSYAPLLQGKPLPKKSPWRHTVFGQYRNTEMARDSRFKLVLRDNGRGASEFFDLADDPREKVNQYDSPKYVNDRDRMTRLLEGWRSGTAS